jgi:hypothetical protein
MDDANNSDPKPATPEESEAKNPPHSDKFQAFTEACSLMKDRSISEGKHLIGGKEQSSQPPTLTQACDSIKAEIPDIARQIVPNVGTKTPPAQIDRDRAGGDSAEFANADTDDRFYSHPIEQAQKATREAKWFEQ